MEFLIKTTRVHGTPVFVTHGHDARFPRVYGATRINGLWYFPAFHPVAQLVLGDFLALQVPTRFSETTQRHIDTLNAVDARIKARKLPEGFTYKTKPFEHQLDGLVHCYYFHRAALFYSCGTGKSKITIDWQRAVGCMPLILCPKVVLNVWAVEVARHGIEQEYRIVDAASKKGKLKQLADIEGYSGLVVSYDTARLYHEVIAELPYNAVVADESHMIKGYRSARTKAATELAGKASRRIIMSGTPSLGNPLDMYSQFRFLAPCLMSENFWHFKNKFCVTSSYNKHVVTGYKNLDVLQKRTSLVALERHKEDCLDLPARTIIDERVPLTKKQQQAYNTLVLSKQYQEFLDEALDATDTFKGPGVVDVANAAVLVNKLLQVTSGFLYKKQVDNLCDGCPHLHGCVQQDIQPHTQACHIDQTPLPRLTDFIKENAKLTALMAKLEEILSEPSHKVIIWAQYHAELDLLEDALHAFWDRLHKEQGGGAPEAKQYHVRVDGQTRSIHDVANTFDRDPNCRVYLGQVSTGVGLTLNAAAYMLYFSLPWRMDAYGQSLDRNHRVGQKEKTFVYRFLGAGTVDEAVAHALRVKGTVVDVLSAVLACATCEQKSTCTPDEVPFGKGCRFSRSISRPTTKVKTI